MKEILQEKGKKRTNMCKFITNAKKYAEQINKIHKREK